MFDNYREFKVSYSTIIDHTTAVSPDNYYFEIAKGDASVASAMTAAGDVTGGYRLSEITGGAEVTGYTSTATDTNGNTVSGLAGWWLDHIVATDVDGKTVVTIQLPETARFNNGLTLKSLAGAVGTDKALNKDVTVNVAVRNVKDATGTRVIDTAVKAMLINDSVNPVLVKVTDAAGNTVDLNNTVNLPTDTTAKLTFQFSEPIQVTTPAANANVLPKNALAIVDGIKVDGTNSTTAIDSTTLAGSAEGKYADACKVTLDVKDLLTKAANGKTFAVGNSYNIKLNGFGDLADNVFASTLNFNIKLTQPVSQTATKPVITKVDQVLDNVFRVEANQANVTGVLAIDNADGANHAVEVMVPLTQAYTIGGVKHYYSYVEVPVSDNAGSPATNKLEFAGAKFVSKKVTVNSVKLLTGAANTDTVAQTGDDYVPASNMIVYKDTLAPELVTPTSNSLAYGSSTTLNFVFDDKTPFAAVDKNENTAIYTLQNTVKQNVKNLYNGNIRLALQYTKADGTIVNKQFDEAVTANGTVQTTPAAITFANDTLSVNLATLEAGALLDSGKLPQGAVYTVNLPTGMLSDGYLNADATENGFGQKNAAANVAALKALAVGATASGVAAVADDDGGADVTFVDAAGREATHGYTTNASTVTFTVGNPTSTVLDVVPQTSEQLITFNNTTKELAVEFTGNPDDSVKNLDNYLINGKTLTSLGAKASDLTVTDTTNGKKVFIKVPAGQVVVDAPVVITVQNVQNVKGAKMTPVSKTLQVKDTTAPQYISGAVTSNRTIELTFDETVQLDATNGATATSAAANFDVIFNGAKISVNSVSANGNKLTLTVGSDIDATSPLSVSVKNNANGKMEVTDVASNGLTTGSLTVK
ncbi:hypothetical protein [Clostridium sp. JS66]|uniref:hypothetical protein n=1 Tax=Clostridium sp. JS66 TaxID=3064705 RepID=UPI00298EB556|nr:hypothetical protein [Clostridium sp. JS66]WPC42245.1 hypothetical protein Q6H37_01845 [Clostridium sp. JS66]